MARNIRIVALGFGALVLAVGGARAASYPAMAPLAQYLSATPADEIALARSAAPPSVSNDAEVLVLGAHGYENAAPGKNGFVCIVERAWANEFGNAEFWNPKMRAPICFNAASARSVLPTYLKRTQWVLAGVPQDEMLARTKAMIASGEIPAPEAGAMCFMQSKSGYLNDAGGHWHPHLMFYVPRIAPAQWGANAPGSPVIGDDGSIEPLTVFFVTVGKWSDGSSAMEMH